MIPYLKSLNISHINYVIASHYHADHIGGIDEVLEAFSADTVFDRGTARKTPTSKTYRDYARTASETHRVTVQPGTTFHLGSNIYLHFIASDGQYQVSSGDPRRPTVLCSLCALPHALCPTHLSPTTYDLSPMSHDPSAMNYPDENSLSIAFTLTYVRHSNLSATSYEPSTIFSYFSGGDLTGYDVGDAIDLETPVARIVGHVDALKINHHGSRFSTNPEFISTLSPVCVFISVGRNNTYGHPAPETLLRLQSKPSVLWIYQTEGANATVPKQRIVGTSVLRFYERDDSSYFTVQLNDGTGYPDYFKCQNFKSNQEPANGVRKK